MTTSVNLASGLFPHGSMGEATITAGACVARASPEGSVCASKKGANQTGGGHRAPEAPIRGQGMKSFLSSFAGHQGGFQDFLLQNSLRLVTCHTYITTN